MPVLFDKSKAEIWTDLDNQFTEMERELTENKEVLNYYQVGDFVNKPTNNSVACIAPFNAPDKLDLFDDD